MVFFNFQNGVAEVPVVNNVPAIAIVPTVEGSPAVEGIAAAVGVRDVPVVWRPLRYLGQGPPWVK